MVVLDHETTLNAAVLNMTDGTPYLPQCLVDFYSDASPSPFGWNWTDGGMALWRFNYTSATARACKALVASTGEGSPQTIASSPVQLTVGYGTRLLLNVTRDYDSTRHVFNTRLLYGSLPVQNRAVKLKLNETEYGGTTDDNGLARIMLWLSPQANNNQTAFNVIASFEGDGTSAASARYTLPNG